MILRRNSSRSLDRIKDVEPILAEGHGRVVRKGYRDTNGMKAEELLYSILSDQNMEGNQIMTYKFQFEANNKIGSAKTPLVSIELDNGERKLEPARKYNDPFPPSIPVATLTAA